MDSKRFDNWTHNRALRLSRRDALRAIGAGGAAATLPTFVPNTLARSPCNRTLHAETAYDQSRISHSEPHPSTLLPFTSHDDAASVNSPIDGSPPSHNLNDGVSNGSILGIRRSTR